MLFLDLTSGIIVQKEEVVMFSFGRKKRELKARLDQLMTKFEDDLRRIYRAPREDRAVTAARLIATYPTDSPNQQIQDRANIMIGVLENAGKSESVLSARRENPTSALMLRMWEIERQRVAAQGYPLLRIDLINRLLAVYNDPSIRTCLSEKCLGIIALLERIKANNGWLTPETFEELRTQRQG